MYSYTVALISGMDVNVLEDPAESCCLSVLLYIQIFTFALVFKH